MFYTAENAVRSWSGYEYQGRITIWFLLDFLKKKITEHKVNDYDSALKILNDYVLEIEGLEDFAIKKGDNYIYINQVKEVSSRNPLTKDVVQQLVLKIIEHKNENINGMFHVVKEKYKLRKLDKVYVEFCNFYNYILKAMNELKGVTKKQYKSI